MQKDDSLQTHCLKTERASLKMILKFDWGGGNHPQPWYELMMVVITKYKPFLCLRKAYAHKSEQVLVCPLGLKGSLEKYKIINKVVTVVITRFLEEEYILLIDIERI